VIEKGKLDFRQNLLGHRSSRKAPPGKGQGLAQRIKKKKKIHFFKFKRPEEAVCRNRAEETLMRGGKMRSFEKKATRKKKRSSKAKMPLLRSETEEKGPSGQSV